MLKRKINNSNKNWVGAIHISNIYMYIERKMKNMNKLVAATEESR